MDLLLLISVVEASYNVPGTKRFEPHTKWRYLPRIPFFLTRRVLTGEKSFKTFIV